MLFKEFRLNREDYLPVWAKVDYNILVAQGVHIGRRIKNLSPFSNWIILGVKESLSVIDLFKFIYMFRAGIFLVEGIIQKRQPLWFVNLEITTSSVVKNSALGCGEYWITESWINGFLTNFTRMYIDVFTRMSLPRVLWKNRDKRLLETYKNWYMSRRTWPRALFVSNVQKSYSPCQEASSLGLPTIGIIDVNSPVKAINIAVPGNNESITSITFYNTLLSMYILYHKFTMVHLWYLNKYKSYSNSIISSTFFSNRKLDIEKDKTIKPEELNIKNIYFFLRKTLLYYSGDLWKNRKISELFFPSVSYSNNRKNVSLSIYLAEKYNKSFKLITLTKNNYLSVKTVVRSLRKRSRKVRKLKKHFAKLISKNRPFIRKKLFFKGPSVLTNDLFYFEKKIGYFVKRWIFNRGRLYINNYRRKIYRILLFLFCWKLLIERVWFSEFLVFQKGKKVKGRKNKKQWRKTEIIENTIIHKIKRINKIVNKFRVKNPYFLNIYLKLAGKKEERITSFKKSNSKDYITIMEQEKIDKKGQRRRWGFRMRKSGIIKGNYVKSQYNFKKYTFLNWEMITPNSIFLLSPIYNYNYYFSNKDKFLFENYNSDYNQEKFHYVKFMKNNKSV